MSNPALDADLNQLAGLVQARTGLVFPATRMNLIEAGARKLMQRSSIPSSPELLHRLQHEPALLDTLLAEITVGESYFFRDTEHFDFIRDVVLDRWRAQTTSPVDSTRFQVWSAGCAAGEEAYSLAMFFEDCGMGDQTSILASDISRRALAKARRGHYSAWSVRGERARQLPATQLLHTGRHYEVAPRLRERVKFFYLNLAQETYPSATQGLCEQHLILCRNVLIYLDSHTIADIARRFHATLRPGGYLLTGPSDPLLAMHAPFIVHPYAGGLAYQKPVSGNHGSVQRPALPRLPVSRLHKEPGPASAYTPKPVTTGTTNRLAPRADASPNVGSAPPATAVDAALTADLYQQALQLYADGNTKAAIDALRRLLYLDATLAMGYFMLGLIHEGQQDLLAAQRAFRNASSAASQLPVDAPLPLAHDETAGALLQSCELRLAALARKEAR